jgi:NTE family protein
MLNMSMNISPSVAGKVSLVIGSGSVKCAAAIGVVKALTNDGVGIDRVVGCSAGSIIGALVAMGFSPDKVQQIGAHLMAKEVTSQRNIMGRLQALAPRLFGFSANKFSLCDDKNLMSRLHQYFGKMKIEDMPIPLHITATDFSNGELVEMSSGNLVEAIRASIALPYIFTPVRREGQLLIDGYLADPLPVSVAMKHGAGVIVAVGFESVYQERIASVDRYAFQLSSILSNNLLKSRLAFHSIAHHAEVLTIIPEFKQRIRLFDIAKIPYIVDEGERAAIEQMPYLRQLLTEQHGQAVSQPTKI